MKRLWHLPWLLCSFVGSMFVIPFPFAGPDGTGMIIATVLGWLVMSHLAAIVIGFALTKRMWWRPIVVLAVALIPTLWFSILFSREKAHDTWYLQHQAVYDRFRENLISPIPASVSDLQFIPYEEAQESHLMLRFTISPEDLDRIIHSKGFVQINTGQFRRPDDLFTNPTYLPLGEPATFYIFNDIQGGYPDKGVGEGYTLKVSSDRKHVIFRREDAAYYLYKYWETPAQRAADTTTH